MKLILNYSNLKIFNKAAEKALKQTLENLKTEVSNMQVVPKEVGTLEESIVVKSKSNKGAISYNTPYVRRLYYHPEFNFRTDKNVNAQGRWLDEFIYGEKKKWLVEKFGKNLKANSGGIVK